MSSKGTRGTTVTSHRSKDLGLAAVERVHREMLIDEPWTVREDRGFTCWGAWVRHRVWAGPATRSAGETTCPTCPTAPPEHPAG